MGGAIRKDKPSTGEGRSLQKDAEEVLLMKGGRGSVRAFQVQGNRVRGTGRGGREDRTAGSGFS